jgi:hypothetical protein
MLKILRKEKFLVKRKTSTFKKEEVGYLRKETSEDRSRKDKSSKQVVETTKSKKS